MFTMTNFWHFLVNWLFFWPLRILLHFRKYLIIFLGVIIIILILLAHYTGDLLVFYRWTLSEVPIYGATKEQEIVIREALGITSHKMRKAILSIEGTDRLPFKANKRQQSEYQIDAVAYHIDGRMFLKLERLDAPDVKADIFHEAGHIFHQALPSWFEKAWEALIGPDADREIYKGQRIFPKNGFLSEKGLQMLKEDIAEYSEEAFSYLDNPIGYELKNCGPLVLVNHPLMGGYDARYKLKLHLMYTVGFFSKAQYDKLIELVERIK